MTRNIVFAIIGCIVLSFVFAAACQFAFPDILPYAAGKDDASSWTRQAAFLTTASAWLSAEVGGLFAIILAVRWWNRSTGSSPARAPATYKSRN